MTLLLPVEERVTNLEELMAQLTRHVGQLSEEMREFKDEMRGVSERHTLKSETINYKEQSRRKIQEMRKQWGELARKMGTMVEDLVLPRIGDILHTVLNCPKTQMTSVAIHVQKRRPTDQQLGRFDAVVICGEYMLINETKSRLRPEDVTAFAQFLPEARTYFPEYASHKIIGAVASLYVDESLVRRGERLGLIVLGFGDDVMDVLNTPDFQPKAF